MSTPSVVAYQCTPYREIRQPHGTGERHRGHGLWVWEPCLPGHRMGQDESHGCRCSISHPMTLAPPVVPQTPGGVGPTSLRTDGLDALSAVLSTE
jgi:hypothetical protein